MQRFLLFLFSFWLLAAPLVAEQNVNPGINLHYRNPDVAQWRGVFEREGREIWDRRDEILQSLRLREGQRVADVGTGTGFFALMIARAVGPSGRVYAVDIAESFVDAAVDRARAQGLEHVIGVVNDQHGISLPPSSVDLVFISDTYHHFEYPKSTLESIHQALAPDGELVVIDFKRMPDRSPPWVIGHVRAGETQAKQEIEAAGFLLSERLDFMRGQYFLRFRKR